MSQSLQATLSQETGLVRQVQSMQSQMIVGFRRGLRPQDDDGVGSIFRIRPDLNSFGYEVPAGAPLRCGTGRNDPDGRWMVAKFGCGEDQRSASTDQTLRRARGEKGTHLIYL